MLPLYFVTISDKLTVKNMELYLYNALIQQPRNSHMRMLLMETFFNSYFRAAIVSTDIRTLHLSI